jgi:hypothetical protein
MSKSHHCGHGRCGVCGDAGEARRDREEDAARADEREDPDPRRTLRTNDAIDRADGPALMSPQCDRETCATWRPCPACRSTRRCRACGTGFLELRLHRSGALIPTCDECGEQWIDAAAAELLDRYVAGGGT